MSTPFRIRDIEHQALAGVEPLIRPSAAAQHLAVSRSELYRLASKGLIPHYRIGEKMLRFRASELEAYVRAGSAGRTAQTAGREGATA